MSVDVGVPTTRDVGGRQQGSARVPTRAIAAMMITFIGREPRSTLADSSTPLVRPTSMGGTAIAHHRTFRYALKPSNVKPATHNVSHDGMGSVLRLVHTVTA